MSILDSLEKLEKRLADLENQIVEAKQKSIPKVPLRRYEALIFIYMEQDGDTYCSLYEADEIPEGLVFVASVYLKNFSDDMEILYMTYSWNKRTREESFTLYTCDDQDFLENKPQEYATIQVLSEEKVIADLTSIFAYADRGYEE